MKRTRAVGLIAVSSIGAADGAWVPPDCPGGIERLVDAARDPGPDTLAEVASEPWFTLDPRLDAAGALAGQRLHPGTGRDRVRFVELPAESAAAGPFGRLVLVAADDGRRSEVTLRADRRRCGQVWTTGRFGVAACLRFLADPWQ